MKIVSACLALVMLAACDRAPEITPEPTSSPLAPGEPAQASIMRPDLATAPPEAAPVEPLDITIGFPDGGSTIPAEGIAQLEKFIASVQVAKGGPIRIGAHSDSEGTDAANLAASKKRGEAVVAWLADKGIAKDRLTLVAFGEQNPVKPNALPDGSPNEEGRAANRRVEIHVPVAGAPADEQREPTLAEEIVEKTGPEPPPSNQTEKSD